MAEIRCFMLEPTGRSVQWLRRSSVGAAGTDTAPGAHWCSAHTVLGVLEGTGHVGGMIAWPRDDPRWPTHCAACGKPLPDGGMWLVDFWHEMRRTDTGATLCVQDAPPGAMWWVAHLDGHDGFYHSAEHVARGGGPHLIVKTPAGDWDIDGKSRSGGGWTRTGEPPAITARPSIGIGPPNGEYQYHAYLTNGVLQDV